MANEGGGDDSTELELAQSGRSEASADPSAGAVPARYELGSESLEFGTP
jgi:hypothetical protein